ncbi:MAG: hypothetical protein LBS36_05225 [Oscillospiraceae bacterium]|jgi:hypothetical protein|nr:hypothetical protein [Oscillospiraceae bacterium]
MYHTEEIMRQIRSCYPLWLLEFKEMDALVSAAARMLEAAANAVVLAVENQFVHSAQDKMIEELERFLGIGYEVLRAGENRKGFIASHFIGNGRFGPDKIKEVVAMFTGSPCNVAYLPDSGIHVEIVRDTNDSFVLNDCVAILNKRKPAHLTLTVTLSSPFSVGAFYGVAMTEFHQETINH